MTIHNHLRYILLSTTLLFGLNVGAQKAPEAYKLYDNTGREMTYQALINALSTPDVVFIGEMHNCVITHWLELKILESLHDIQGKNLEVGMEMFEADTQLIIDEYLNGSISSDCFEEEARIWPNYSTDYAPIVSYVKDNRLPLIATNVPRRYANAVKNHGLAFTLARSQAIPSPSADSVYSQCQCCLRLRYDGGNGQEQRCRSRTHCTSTGHQRCYNGLVDNQESARQIPTFQRQLSFRC